MHKAPVIHPPPRLMPAPCPLESAAQKRRLLEDALLPFGRAPLKKTALPMEIRGQQAAAQSPLAPVTKDAGQHIIHQTINITTGDWLAPAAQPAEAVRAVCDALEAELAELFQDEGGL